ncbi:hypothetical protein SAMN05216371_0526 [Streptomyces sp. TLI_053]|uniref:DUF6603 domain-containing protein n=1 Tax=Streptomyces sp. TLI_053 TaxID=1855352 RepID=UPI00087AB806|nr:DUF6603 domain-containing protein [Streptomyces sp. TLI_053]SDS74369.1 hypothetical protein SAMN05216371_0526 [Streptomyces sp. TLI_053]
MTDEQLSAHPAIVVGVPVLDGDADRANEALRLLLARAKFAVGLSDLPLVGAMLPADAVTLTGAQLAITTGTVTAAEAQRINSLLTAADPKGTLPRVAAAGMPQKFQFGLVVRVGDKVHELFVPVRAAPTKAGTEQDGQQLGLVFGPVRLRRLTLTAEGAMVAAALDAALVIGPVEFALLGLGLGIRLASPPEFVPQLRGASLLIDKPPLRVAGLLERRKTAEYSELITGMLSVETSVIAMEAMGCYARAKAGWTSVFLFGEIGSRTGAGLFGPPAFTVNALSGGFGVNSTVRVPEVTEIGRFPLVARLAGGGGGTTPQQVMTDLMEKGWIQPRQGRYWAALGIDFSCFKFLQVRALALLEFGDEFTATVLGRASITFPKNAQAGRKVHARLTVDIRFAVEPAKHLLSLDAVVADGSFVFDESVRLTGGIGMRVWTGGVHGGDFVVSAGGYHPDYLVPAHYPRPARLGFVWSPDSKVRISSQGYTALTPSAFMLGGTLEARYDKGMLSAWFVAHLHALIRWSPFRLELALGIRIGVAFTIKVLWVNTRVSIETGIDLQLWAPPLGGRVTVKVWFVSFSFTFGSRRVTPPPATWAQLRQQLPEPLGVTPLRGVLVDVTDTERKARAEKAGPMLVSAYDFALATRSAVPANKVTVNGKEIGLPSGLGPLSIRPMDKSGITSEHRVRVLRNNSPYDWHGAGWRITPLTQQVPSALWGVPGGGQEANDRKLFTGVSGLRIEVPPALVGGSVGPATEESLGSERLPDGRIPLRHTAAQGPVPVVDGQSVGLIARTLNASAQQSARTATYRALAGLGVAPDGDWNGPLAQYARQVEHSLTDAPLTTTSK